MGKALRKRMVREAEGREGRVSVQKISVETDYCLLLTVKLQSTNGITELVSS